MNYFLDTEFDEDGKTIELISLALVAQDGRELYAVSTEFDPERCNAWVKANVLPKLPDRDETSVWWKTRDEIRYDITAFIGDDPAPRFWAYFADYDWVVFCRLWGQMVDLPSKFPMYCLDLKQTLHHMQVSDIKGKVPQSVTQQHDALVDARWNRDVFEWVKKQTVSSFHL